MRELIRSIAVHVLSFLGAYVVLTGVGSYVCVEAMHRDVGVPWALFWMIWVFVYWPVALGTAFVLWRLRPTARLAAMIHGTYIAAALLALAATAQWNTWWPMFVVKLAGLGFIFYCITGFRRQSV